MKKLLFITLAVIMALALCACSQSNKNPAVNPAGGNSTPTNPAGGNNATIKTWENRAFLDKIDPKSVTGIYFVTTKPDLDAQEKWRFEKLDCFFADGSVYIVTGEKIKIAGSMNGAFADLVNLQTISGLEHLDTSEVISAASMFQGCKALSELDMSSLNMQKVTNMDNIFSKCTSLARLKLPKTRDVTSMSKAFEEVGRGSLTNASVYGTLNTQMCKNMSYMFHGSCLGDYTFVQDFNTASLVNAEGMFADCAIYNIDLSKWNTQNLETTEKMFYCDMHITNCNITGWNVQSLKNCKSMFFVCANLREMTLGWTNVNSLQDVSGLFENCFQIKTIDVSCFDNLQFKTANEMFMSCESLQTIYCNGFSANASKDMFNGCYELVGAVKYSENALDGSMANLKGYFSAKN